MRLAEKLREIYYGDTPFARISRYTLLTFDLVVISFFVVTTFLPPAKWIYFIDYMIGGIMILELVARFMASYDRARFFTEPLILVDILVIISLLAPAFVESFAFLRVLRALRLFQSYRLLQELRHQSRFFVRHEEVVFAVLHLLIFIFVVSALVFVLQVRINPEISNYVDALYFAVTTLTTTGFGDITLIGSTGRLLSIIVMIVGISLFINLAKSIFRPTKVRHECPECGLMRHDPDAVHCKHCGTTLHIRTEGD